MKSIQRTDSLLNPQAGTNPPFRADLIKEIIIKKFLDAMFSFEFGIGDYLKIPKTDSINEFSKQFLSHGARAIRIALKLDDAASVDQVKKALIGKTVDIGMQPDESKLMGMPPGVDVDEVRRAELELTPGFAEMFGVDGSPSEYELHVITNLVIGVIQREKYGLVVNASDEELFAAMS